MADKKQRQRETVKAIKDITKDIASLGRDDDPMEICQILEDQFNNANRLYPQVKKKLDGSAADARLIKDLMRLSKATAKRINTPNKFDVGRALRALKRDIGDVSKLKDNIMRECVMKCFMVAPTFEYFYGAIQKEGIVIKQRKKRIKIVEETNVVTKKAAERNLLTECEQDTTPKEVEAIYNKIRTSIERQPRRNRVPSKQKQSVGLLPIVVDPSSFPQTVENIFHLAFLAKEGKVGIIEGTNDQPVLTHEEKAPDPSEQSIQSILSFSMSDYRKWLTLCQQPSDSRCETADGGP